MDPSRYLKPLYLILFTGTTIMTSCDRYKYNVGTFPDKPVNMEIFNSVYDDYNSSSPILGTTGPLCFSTNRSSSGNNFDIIYKVLSVIMSRRTGIITVDDDQSVYQYICEQNANLQNATWKINTDKNELGPYIIPQGFGYRGEGDSFVELQNYIFLYANDESGNLDIKFTENLNSDNYSTPKDVVFLNSGMDDAYPAINSDSSVVYFCSNREGNFDIYSAVLNKTGSLFDAFNDSTPRIISNESVLSSDYDDKCPFILGNLMVFTSNRPGGFGGYDLYYSTFKDGSWSVPVNFGEKINSDYDEYRPIVKTFESDFTNDFMIFSSDRPGGVGGFDLYYVGIKKMTK